MFFILPRGAKKKVEKILTKWDCVLQPVRDKMLRFPPANFKLTERSVLRPYQEDAVKALVQEGNGTIRGPCGSGKTVILIAAIAAINQPTLVIVHSRTLAQQWRAALNAWLGFQPGSIESGKRVIRPVTVATQQSVWKAIENNEAPWLQKFSVLVGDEIHHWAARTFQIVTSAFPGAWRIGASADERRKDGMEHLIYETFGDPVAKIKKDHLIQIGKLLPSRMEVVKTSYFDEVYVDSVR
jgi:superfamily II DNA or RNA helicase